MCRNDKFIQFMFFMSPRRAHVGIDHFAGKQLLNFHISYLNIHIQVGRQVPAEPPQTLIALYSPSFSPSHKFVHLAITHSA